MRGGIGFERCHRTEIEIRALPQVRDHRARAPRVARPSRRRSTEMPPSKVRVQGSTMSCVTSHRHVRSPPLQDRNRVDRRTRRGRQAKGSDHREERPAALLLTNRGEVFELQVVQQMNAQHVDGERVHWKVDTFDRARCGVAVAVAAECGDLSLPTNSSAVGCRPARACAASQAPSCCRLALWPTRTNSRSPCPMRSVLRFLGGAELSERDVVARLEPGQPA